jgi:two-component system, NtrC family, C4-dicarboxylate transport sensor histidine kinase DctB
MIIRNVWKSAQMTCAVAEIRTICVAMAPIRTFTRLSWAALVAILILGGAMILVSGRLAAGRAEAQLASEAAESADLLGALLASEIEHYRALPLVLSSDDQIAAALVKNDSGARARLSDRLSNMSREIGAAAVYLVGADGITVAASNAREPGSFVGVDYRFRDYFSTAMRDGSASQFALGSTTLRPGLYLSQRVDRAGTKIGVIVVKVEFNQLEASWQRSGTQALVTDGGGEILITTQPKWRFRPITDILPGVARGERNHELTAADIAAPGQYSRAQTKTIIPGWTLHALLPADDRVNSAVTAASALMALAIAFGGTALLWFFLRQRRAAIRTMEAEAARRELEQRVEQRTSELQASTSRLVEEMSERQRIEAAARVLNEELEQANRLTILGQIAAGVTHEINQPVAAIRATADNAAVLLDQGQSGPARTAMGRITKLTERIGAITGELRAFSAKGSGGARLISVDATIDGALQLVGANLQQSQVKLVRCPRDPALKIWAEKIRVEQILVNLLRNAIDALADQEDARISIDIGADRDWVYYRVADNGPGIAADLASHLFTPFRTTKVQGLGLGLVISRDIAASMGGELDLVQAPSEGAEPSSGANFELKLPRPDK